MVTETKYIGPIIRETRQGLPEFVLMTDQLRVPPTPSAVRFNLPDSFPYPMQGQTAINIVRLDQTKVIACYMDLERYLFLGEYKGDWFNHNQKEKPEREYLERLLESIKITATSPFLFSGNYPEECRKTYDLMLPIEGYHRLRITVENRGDLTKENVTMKFLRRKRGNQIIAIDAATLVRNPISWQKG